MAIAFVNAASGISNLGGGTTTSYALPATSLTAGNLIVVCINGQPPDVNSDYVTSIADTAGNTYTRISGKANGSSDARMEVWYAKNVAGNASNIVTFTLGVSIAYYSGCSVQYSGLDTSAPLDATATGNGSGTSVTSGSFTTIVADEVLVACAAVFNGGAGAWTAGTGYTKRVEDDATITMFEDKIVSATQAGVTAAATAGKSGGLAMVVGTFAAPTSPPPPSPGSLGLVATPNVNLRYRTVVVPY